MSRQRGFDEDDVVGAAAGVFTRLGFEGTSIDDLVRDLGVHRGSLYRVFGSKLGLFGRAVAGAVDEVVAWAAAGADGAPPAGMDLFLVAAVERAPVDDGVAAEIRRGYVALRDTAGADTAGLVGRTLLARAGITNDEMEG